jgi:ABC-type amino acid transport substrate-binding protein
MRALMAAALATIALALTASSALADPPPTTLEVGLTMPSAGFENGAVRGHDVVFARGFEIDLARAIATRMGIHQVAFYQEPQFLRLIAAGQKPWDIALAEVTITQARLANVAFSVPYMNADDGVLLRRGLTTTPKTLAQLAGLQLCTQSSTTSADVIANRIQPTRPARLFGNTTLLLDALQAGKCDAVVYDAPILATLRAQVPERYGPLAGVIATGDQYGVVLPQGSPLVPLVNQAIAGLTANGTIAALARRWLDTNLATLPVLR